MPRERMLKQLDPRCLAGERMREQLDPRCLGGECASSWIHDALGENAQAAGSTMPWGRECASSWIHNAS